MMDKTSKATVYCLFMQLKIDGVIKGYDLFGVYSTKEKAELAMEWLYRGDGWWEGCQGELYNGCAIDTRIIDCNLP